MLSALCACASNVSNNASNTDSIIGNESAQCEITSKSDSSIATQPTEDVQPIATQTEFTRQQAYNDAFKSGKELGYSDGLNGVYDGQSYASVYSDDWIKQAFLQGYDFGQAEAASQAEPESYDYDSDDYEDYDDYYDE